MKKETMNLIQITGWMDVMDSRVRIARNLDGADDKWKSEKESYLQAEIEGALAIAKIVLSEDGYQELMTFMKSLKHITVKLP